MNRFLTYFALMLVLCTAAFSSMVAPAPADMTTTTVLIPDVIELPPAVAAPVLQTDDDDPFYLPPPCGTPCPTPWLCIAPQVECAQ